MTAQQDAQDAAKRRRWHRDMAVVAKISREPCPIPVAHMSDVQLSVLSAKLTDELWQLARESPHVRIARAVRDLIAVDQERNMRGHQLHLEV
jgi:hypothetical protein